MVHVSFDGHLCILNLRADDSEICVKALDALSHEGCGNMLWLSCATRCGTGSRDGGDVTESHCCRSRVSFLVTSLLGLVINQVINQLTCLVSFS